MQALDAARRRQRVAREPGEEGELARAEPGSVLPSEALERGERRGRCRSSHGSILAGPLRYSTFMHRMIPAAALLAILAASPHAEAADAGMDAAAAGRFAQLALACIQREYPNKIAHVLDGDADVQPPRSLTPVFYGCFDWHSSVHGHWLLARLAREYPDARVRGAARARRLPSALRKRKSPRRSPICRARVALHSSDPMALPGSCSSRRNCAAGTMPTRSDGRRSCSRSKPRLRTGSAPGCRSFTTRSASASIRRPHSPSASFATGRSCRATRRCAT